jgi:hypothetical protein
MSVKVSFASGSWSMKIDNEHRFDLTIYEDKITNQIWASVWKEGNAHAIGFYVARYFKWSLILPKRLAVKMYRKQLEKHQRKLNEILAENGHDLIVKFVKEATQDD